MKCPKCHTENLADSAFCEECSAPLEAACPTCGTGNRPTAKFCRKCRAPLAPSDKPNAEARAPLAPRVRTRPSTSPTRSSPRAAALEGERKQVTVLFADVKGSMELAEQRRPGAVAHDPATASSACSPTACIASRAPSTSTPATASWRCSARRSRTRTTRSAPATRRCSCATTLAALRPRGEARARPRLLGAHGAPLGRGRRRQDRRRPAHGLHRPGAHGGSRGAHAGAGLAGHGLPDRTHRRAGLRLLRAGRSRDVPREGRHRAGARSSSSRGSARCARASTPRAPAA